MSPIIRRLLGGVLATCLVLALLRPAFADPWPEEPVSRQLGEAYRLQRDGHFDAALAAYHAFLDPAEQGSQPSEKSRANALICVAQLHQRLGQLTEAGSSFEQLLAEYPGSRHTAGALLGLGEIARRTQNPTLAGAHYKEVQSRFPQSTQAKEAAYWLALAAADEKDSQTARRYAGWLIAELSHPRKPPTQPDSLRRREQQLLNHARYLLIQIAVAEREWEEVSSASLQLQATAPEGALRTAAEFWLAEAAFRLGDDDLARKRFARLATRVIGLAEAWVPMVPLRTAQLAARRQQWTEVLEIVGALGRDYPDFPLRYEVDYLQGRALAGKGEMTAARRAYTRVLDNQATRETETAAMAEWMIGETFFHQRDYPRARQAYMRVIDEHNFTAWQARAALQAGKCWELEGEWQQAIDQYAGALKRWPDLQPEEELKARMQWAQRHTPSRPLAIANRP